MSVFLRTTALMLLMLSRAPAFAAIPTAPGSEQSRSSIKMKSVLKRLSTT